MPVPGDKLFIVTSSKNLIKFFLLINLVSGENVFKYISLKDETGSLVCANARPDLVIYRIRSPIACASSCSSDSQCEDFNFSSRLHICELFYSSQILRFQISRNCVFYTKRTNIAVVKSMATVNNGAAYTTKVLTSRSDNTISTVATGTTDATGTKTTATTSQPTSSTFAGQTRASKTEKIAISSNNISSTGERTLQTTTGSIVGSTTAETVHGATSGALNGATSGALYRATPGALNGETAGTTTKPNTAVFGQTSATITQAAAVAQPIITTTPTTASTTTKAETTIPISTGKTSTITASTKATTLSSTSTTKIASIVPTSAVSTSSTTTTTTTTVEASTKTILTLPIASSSSTTTTAATSKTTTTPSSTPTTKIETTTKSPSPTSLASTTTAATTVVATTTKTIPTSTLTTTTTPTTTSKTTVTPTTAKAMIFPISSTTPVTTVATTTPTTTTLPTSKTSASTTTTKTSVMQTTKATTTIKTTARAAAAQVTGPTGLPYPTSGLVQQPSTSILLQNNVNTPNAFNRPWLDFQKGFGDSNGNYWLGNDAIHNYLAGHPYQLYVYVYPVSAVYPYLAIYQWYFVVGDSTSNYQLALSKSGGNATSDGMGSMSNQMFSTSDKDNDVDSHNCAITYGAGWWYGGNPLNNGYQCGTTMLNGCGNNFVWEQDTTLTLRASQMWLVY